MNRRVPGYSLALFRICFGLVGFLSAARIVLNGWVQTLYLEPSHHFKYLGFEWVSVPSAEVLYGMYALLAIASIAVAAGAFFRYAMPTFFLVFTYLELMDQTYYLNHYYFISLCAFLMCFMPMNKVWSVDAFRNPSEDISVGQWSIEALRVQFVILYFFAGLAKLNPDWLLTAEPLRTWLLARTETPIIGPLLGAQWVAFAGSYAACIFDLSIGFLLFSKRTRTVAYAAVVFFHLGTALLFNIGLFPWVMIALTPIFFAPDWPLKFLKKPASLINPTEDRISIPRWGYGLLSLYFLIQIALPLRHHAIDNDVLWSEDGYLFSWRVMLTEKTGVTDFYAEHPQTGKRWLLPTCDLLTPVQKRKMSSNPDFIVQTAHWLHEGLKAQGLGEAGIYAESFASLNGKLSQRMIDPRIDLARVDRSWGKSHWVLPVEPTPEQSPIMSFNGDSTIAIAR